MDCDDFAYDTIEMLYLKKIRTKRRASVRIGFEEKYLQFDDFLSFFGSVSVDNE